MKKEKNKNQSFLDGFLADFVLTRRSFIKKASAATGTAAALGGLQPSLRALAASGEVSAAGNGRMETGHLSGMYVLVLQTGVCR